MKTNNNDSTDIYLDDLTFISFGKSGEIEVYEDLNSTVMEILLKFCKYINQPLRIIKRNPICHKCGKPLNRNGYKVIYPDKIYEVHLQKYIHKKCKSSSCIASANAIKRKHCIYSRETQEKSILTDFVCYKSYASKSKEMINYTGVKVPLPTLLYYHKTYSNEFMKYVEHLQYKRIEELNIKPSGVYCYDEQYVFINKTLYLRLTIIDHHNKLIINDELIAKEDFNNKTIEKFLRKSLENKPLKVIITDGRKGYKQIIEAVGAIQHRCLFHVLQNLIEDLTPYTNKKEKRIKTINSHIAEKEEEIKSIRVMKKKYPGRTPHSDKKTIREEKKIRKINKEIKELKDERSEIKKELKKIENEKTRVENIWKESKTVKDANKRFKTLYNERKFLDKRIAEFIRKIEPNIEYIINHIENDEIPTTNNRVENFYRTTLPRKQKRIYRTVEGLKQRMREEKIKWTHRVVLGQNTPINYQTVYV